MKTLKIVLTLVVFTILTGCELGIEPSTEEPVMSSSSVTVTQTYVKYSSSSSVIKYSSSSKGRMLTEICDEAIVKVMNKNNINTKEQACTAYQDNLKNVEKLNDSQIKYCMKSVDCVEQEVPACNMRMYNVGGYSEDYLKNLCASFKMQGSNELQNCTCSKIIK